MTRLGTAEFIVVLVPESVGWSVLFPDLPGCATQGDTLDEAIAMAADAVAGHTASMRDHGDQLPPPRSYDAVRADDAWAAEYGVNWSTAVVSRVRVATGA